MLVYSARVSYGGPDRLDVTRKSGGPAGEPFAPSWALLAPALAARADADLLLKLAARTPPGYDPAEAQGDAERIEAEAWDEYVPGFLAEMRESYARHRPAWRELLARPRVVLVCFCTNAERCHRGILRSYVLPRLGAVDAGELAADATEPHPPPMRRCTCGWPTVTQFCAACAADARRIGIRLALCEPGEVATR